LTEAILSFRKRLAYEVPAWAEDFRFPLEVPLLEQDQRLVAELEEVRSKEESYSAFKAVLCQDGDRLVESVTAVLRDGFGFIVPDQEEEFIEDRTLVDADGKAEALVEIKGKNKGVSSEAINQTHSHRERRELPASFPAVLIINSFAESTSLEDKDRPVGDEQVEHAAKNGVLIVRTLDLLHLLSLVEAGKLDAAKVLALFKSEKGWLRADSAGYAVLPTT
jgi:hypothetical protein